MPAHVVGGPHGAEEGPGVGEAGLEGPAILDWASSSRLAWAGLAAAQKSRMAASSASSAESSSDDVGGWGAGGGGGGGVGGGGGGCGNGEDAHLTLLCTLEHDPAFKLDTWSAKYSLHSPVVPPSVCLKYQMAHSSAAQRWQQDKASGCCVAL